jgi:hypothetical protein
MAADDWKLTKKGVLVEAHHTSGMIVVMCPSQPWRPAKLLNAPPEWKPWQRSKFIKEARAVSGCKWG